jgi:hypothetical protein
VLQVHRVEIARRETLLDQRNQLVIGDVAELLAEPIDKVRRKLIGSPPACAGGGGAASLDEQPA